MRPGPLPATGQPGRLENRDLAVLGGIFVMALMATWAGRRRPSRLERLRRALW